MTFTGSPTVMDVLYAFIKTSAVKCDRCPAPTRATSKSSSQKTLAGALLSRILDLDPTTGWQEPHRSAETGTDCDNTDSTV